MRRSPIQLLQASLLKVVVEPVQDERFTSRGQPSPFEYDHVVLESARACKKFSQFWEKIEPPAPGMVDRTYVVHLGLRTPPDGQVVGPYAFEIVASGVVAVMPDRPPGNVTDEDLAFQYGLALVYGVIREQLGALTRRMPWGDALLPTMSFLDDRCTPTGALVSHPSDVPANTPADATPSPTN